MYCLFSWDGGCVSKAMFCESDGPGTPDRRWRSVMSSSPVLGAVAVAEDAVEGDPESGSARCESFACDEGFDVKNRGKVALTWDFWICMLRVKAGPRD